jgi:DNA polymerase-3 subunit gamma/tau
MSWFRSHRPNQVKNLHLTDVRQSILGFMEKGEIPQVMLFAGPKGTGKTSLARIIGAMLNDEKNQAVVDHQFFLKTLSKKAKYQEPDPNSEMSLRILRGQSFIVQEMDAASNRGIDDIREIKQRVGLPPQEGKMTVYILDEAHMLTTSAFNALLKLLEEPPKHAVFILATTELHKIPATIKSRCSVIYFRKASIEEVKNALVYVLEKEKVEYEEEAIETIARQADGSFRDAIKLLQMVVTDNKISAIKAKQVLFSSSQKDVLALIKHLLDKDEQAVASLFQDLRSRNVDQSFYHKSLLEALHTSMLCSIGILEGEAIVDKAIAQFLLKNLAQLDISLSPIPHLSLELKILELINRSKNRSGNGQLKKIDHSKTNQASKPKQALSAQPTKKDSNHQAQKKLDLPTKNQKTGDSKQLFANWQKLLSQVKKKNITLEALLRSTKPVKSANGTAHVQVYYKFHKEQLEQPKFKALISDCANDIAGGQVKIVYELASVPAKADLKPADSQDLAALAEEILV